MNIKRIIITLYLIIYNFLNNYNYSSKGNLPLINESNILNEEAL